MKDVGPLGILEIPLLMKIQNSGQRGMINFELQSIAVSLALSPYRVFVYVLKNTNIWQKCIFMSSDVFV